MVQANNLGIIDLLSVIEGRQRDTLARLDALRPDPGPGGTPRIGVGAALTSPPQASAPAGDAASAV
ncbi:MAG: hypothetical protein INR63_23040 [Actinomycetospora chiangmaiensis]|nr:hypothetical protein [Actinomycetospora chiangmaiensis]